jgi:ectoine hydroxylase-related dioxygenase (phytanoyl-CoA dioxygenase family)
MDIPRFKADASPSEVGDALLADGAAIVEELVTVDACERMRVELQPWIDETPFGGDEFSGRTTRRTGALLARSATSREMIANPLVLAAVDQVLWAQKTTFQLHLTQAITIGPGSPAQNLHRDHWCFDFFPFPDDVQVEVGTMWALDEFTEANGATRVSIGSHRLPEVGLQAFDVETVPATMPAGSVVLYTGRTVHGGGANATDSSRIGINVDYALGWLRQEENQYLSVPIEVVRELPEDIQRLMGYAHGAYALGYVDDVRDPIDVLTGAGPRSQSFSGRSTQDG